MQYNFKLFRGSEEAEMAEYTKIKTKSHKDDESIAIVKEETKLTESGEYLIALHWLEEGSASEERDTLKRMLEDKV